jgi:hypothetical protein
MSEPVSLDGESTETCCSKFRNVMSLAAMARKTSVPMAAGTPARDWRMQRADVKSDCRHAEAARAVDFLLGCGPYARIAAQIAPGLFRFAPAQPSGCKGPPRIRRPEHGTISPRSPVMRIHGPALCRAAMLKGFPEFFCTGSGNEQMGPPHNVRPPQILLRCGRDGEIRLPQSLAEETGFLAMGA